MLQVQVRDGHSRHLPGNWGRLGAAVQLCREGSSLPQTEGL